MTDQLVITSITAKKFGGLSDFTLDLGSNNFVVVFGPNESGKSTIAELISWLLVGPLGNAKNAQRYGDYEEYVTGLLKGTVRGRQFEANGRFKILARDAPNEDGLEVRLDGQDPIEANEWRGHIGGLTPKMFEAVYWMAGKDLHDDTAVREEIVETGGLAGISLSSVTKELNTMILECLNAAGEKATSFKTLDKEKDAVEQAIMDISSNADEYTRHGESIQALTKEKSGLDERLAELHNEIEARKILIETTEARQEQKEVVEGLKDLDPIPPEWLPIAQSFEHFEMCAEKLDRWTEKVETRRKDFLDACRIAGTDEADGRLVNVRPANLQSITKVGQQLTHTVEELRRVNEDLVPAESEYESASKNLATCTETAERLGVEDLSSILSGNTQTTTLAGAITSWKDREVEVALKAAATTDLNDEVRQHENDVDRANKRWEKFDTRMTAQKWLESGPKPPPTLPQATSVNPLIVAAVVAVVAVVANFALPSVLGGIITAVALGIGIVVARWRPRKLTEGDPSAAAEPPSPEETDHPRAAAIAVDDAERHRDYAIGRQQVAQGELDKVTQRRNKLADTARSYAREQGFDLGDEADRAVVIAEAVSEAVTARSDHQEALKRKTDLSTLQDKLDQEVTEHKSKLGSLMTNCALPEGIEIEVIKDLIGPFENLTQTRVELEQAEADKATAQEEWDQALGSVPSGETEPAILLTRARNYASINEEIVKLERRQSELSKSIDKSFDKNPLVKTYSLEKPSELESRLSDLSNERNTSDERRTEVLKEIGTLDGEVARLKKSEEHQRLKLKSGALNEMAEDRMLLGTSSATARHVLKGAVEEHRLANQDPVLTSSNEMLVKVQTKWKELWTPPGDNPEKVSVIGASGEHLSSEKLSTGMNALLHLTLRLAVADHDAQKRGLRLPILCDDPLAHIDDIRAPLTLPLLKEMADRGHQVILFTCKDSTFAAAQQIGADPKSLNYKPVN